MVDTIRLGIEAIGEDTSIIIKDVDNFVEPSTQEFFGKNFLTRAYLKNYSIGKLVDLVEIIDGIDNSNFILQTNFLENNQQKIINKKFILTIFEKRIDEKDLPFFINLKLHLAKKGINCPFPILDNKGEVITKIANKNSVIVSFLEGKTLKPVNDGYYESITVNHCKEVGSILAKMHLSALDFSQKRINDLSVKNFSKLFAKFSDLVDQYHQGLKAEITENIKLITCTEVKYFSQNQNHQNI
jgi:homoserine kinase type II